MWSPRIVALCLLAAFGTQYALASAELPFGFPITAHFPFLLDSYENSKFSVPAADDSSEKYLAQPIDHFAKTTNNFQQRYFVNTKFSNSSGVHILYIEGAQGATSDKVTNDSFPWVSNAKEVKATVWLLEHRFYGKSKTYSTASVTNLATLNSYQAVEDIKYFIQQQNKASGETNPKWIVYGGYYGGSLALWFRQQYPGLSVGAVASSAPALAALDFYRYQKNVEDAYQAYDQSCYNNLASAVTEVRHLIQSVKGRKKLSDTLRLSPAFDKLSLVESDFQFFYVVLLSFLQYPVQFNKVNWGPFSTSGGIADVCKLLKDNSVKDLDKVKNIVSYMIGLGGGDFSNSNLPNNYTQLVGWLADESQMRNFLWQQCNELGFFTTTDYGSGGLFGSSIPNNFWINVCEDVFGKSFDVDNLKAGVKKSKSTYGASSTYTGKNAFIVRNMVDPWRTLGHITVSDPTSSIYNASGSAFTADLQPPSNNDVVSVKMARNLINRRIKQWISGSNNKRAYESNHIAEEKKTSKDMQGEIKASSWETEINWHEKLPTEFEKVPHPKTPYIPNIKKRHNLLDVFKHKMGDELYQKERVKVSEKAGSGFIRSGSIKQNVDHFDSKNNDVYRQFFMLNDQYDDGSQLVFLMIGGEAPIDPFFIGSEYIAMVQWGAEYGALLLELEHRFYGRSQPTEDLSVPNLKYLHSEQALADAAVFINKVNKDRNYTTPRWIAFGGSYPGSLSAWIRLKYPSLIYASIASSAPVQAKTDYFEYMQTVQNSTRAFGTKTCMSDVHKFFAWAQQQMTTVAGRNGMATLFGLCNKWDTDYIDPKDAEFFLGMFVYQIAGTVQYDDEGHSRLQKRCKWFEQVDQYLGAYTKQISFTGDDTEEHQQIVKQFSTGLQQMLWGSVRAGDEDDCFPFSYQIILDELRQDTPYYTDERCWIWQTCNELGVAQSTNFGYNIFESTLPVNHFMDLCYDVYGKDRDYVDAHVRATNADYGGQDYYNGTQVVFVNGSEDPWNPLSVYNPKDKSVSSFLIDGSSHCEDMFILGDYDTKAVKKAHRAIKKILKSWGRQSKEDAFEKCM
ncbi:serine carboxypeptidase s28 domain-containing protein [Ditylenchus destructor]|uniref:Serine carboxypeptidase s28 domain-containing protein n=1 Tax=Ditylenchus destructor TaxID=166010 RepID=A0AAD4R1R8_9BILA|nr:serine carboxypeptidase s28 domain-containing protein [Ditylenchus destructor]